MIYIFVYIYRMMKERIIIIPGFYIYIYICIINLKLNLKTCFDRYSIDSKNQNWYIKV